MTNEPKKRDPIAEEVDRAIGADDTQPAPAQSDDDVVVWLDKDGELK